MRKGIILLALLLCATCTLSACADLLPDDEPETIVQVHHHTDTDVASMKDHVEWLDATYHRVHYKCPICGEVATKDYMHKVVDGKCEECGVAVCTHPDKKDNMCTVCGGYVEENHDLYWTSWEKIDSQEHRRYQTCRGCGVILNEEKEFHSDISIVHGVLTCGVCGERIACNHRDSYWTNWEKVDNEKHSRRHICPTCDEVLEEESVLHSDISIVHGYLTCGVCEGRIEKDGGGS